METAKERPPRIRSPQEEWAKRQPTRTSGARTTLSLAEMLEHLDAKSRGMREDIGRKPPDRGTPPRDELICPFDDPILFGIVRLAEKCLEFLEAVADGQFSPSDTLPIPPARQSFRIQLDAMESDQIFRDFPVAERYARLWCGQLGQSGVNVRIIRVVKTVEAHYRATESGREIQLCDPDFMGWLREAATELLGRPV